MYRVKKNSSYCLLMSLLCILNIACRDGSKEQIAKELSNFIGRNVSLPNNLEYFGLNSNPSYLQSVSVRLIVWVDSTECAPCAVESMYLYDELAEFCRDSISNAEFCFMFTPSIKDKEILVSNLNVVRPVYDVYVDSTSGMYLNNNSLPSNKLLHTFLLDVNGEVLLSGNPVFNSKMTNLYKTKLLQLCTRKDRVY